MLDTDNCQLFVRIHGKIISISIPFYAPIYKIKELIFIKENIPILNQRLIFAGRQLLDNHLVMDCKLTNESQIDLSMRVRGGMPRHRTSHHTSHSGNTHSSGSGSSGSGSSGSGSGGSGSGGTHSGSGRGSALGGGALRLGLAAGAAAVTGLFGEEIADGAYELFCDMAMGGEENCDEIFDIVKWVFFALIIILSLFLIGKITGMFGENSKMPTKGGLGEALLASGNGGNGRNIKAQPIGAFTYLMMFFFVVACVFFIVNQFVSDEGEAIEDTYPPIPTVSSARDSSQMFATNIMKYDSNAVHGKCCKNITDDSYEICPASHNCVSNVCVINPLAEPIPLNDLDEELQGLDEQTDFINDNLKEAMIQLIGDAADDAVYDIGFKLIKGVGSSLILHGPTSILFKHNIGHLNGGGSLFHPRGRAHINTPRRGVNIRRLKGLSGLISPFDILVSLLDLWDPAGFGDYISNVAAKKMRDELDKSYISDLKLLGVTGPYVFQLDHLNSTHLHVDWFLSDWTTFDFIYYAYKEAYNRYLYTKIAVGNNCALELAKQAEGVSGTPTEEQLNKMICRLSDVDGSESLNSILNGDPEERDNTIFYFTHKNIHTLYIDLHKKELDTSGTPSTPSTQDIEVNPDNLSIPGGTQQESISGWTWKWQNETVDSLKQLIKREYYIFDILNKDESDSSPIPPVNPVATSQPPEPIIINDKTRLDAYKLINSDVETINNTQPLKDYILRNSLPTVGSEMEESTTYSELSEQTTLTNLFTALSNYCDGTTDDIAEEVLVIFNPVEKERIRYIQTVNLSGESKHLMLLKEIIAFFQSIYEINYAISCIQNFNGLSTNHRSGISLSEFGVEQYVTKINNTIEAHENGLIYPDGPRTFPESYVFTEDNMVNIAAPIYSDYYRDLNSTAELDIDPAAEFKSFMSQGALGYTMNLAESQLDSQYKIPGEILMYKVPAMNGTIKTYKNGIEYQPTYNGKIPQIYLNKITMDKTCRKGLPGMYEMQGGGDSRPNFMNSPTFQREQGPHIDNILLDEQNNTGLCVNIEEDFCQTRLGSYQAVGSGKISTSVYKNSSCLPPADNLLYTECNFDDNETECSGDCSWFSSDYPTTSLSPIMVDNCDTTYRDAIAEWGGVGITLSGTVGRVLGELGVTTGASTEEIEDNTIDALEITSLVLGGG